MCSLHTWAHKPRASLAGVEASLAGVQAPRVGAAGVPRRLQASHSHRRLCRLLQAGGRSPLAAAGLHFRGTWLFVRGWFLISRPVCVSSDVLV